MRQLHQTMKCPICKQTVVEKPTIIDQSRNGVKVLKYLWKDGNTGVVADCSCHGMTFRTHDNMACPNLAPQLAVGYPRTEEQAERERQSAERTALSNG
jgi:hypothetical protein